jgi:hypothetical protein
VTVLNMKLIGNLGVSLGSLAMGLSRDLRDHLGYNLGSLGSRDRVLCRGGLTG